MPADSEGHSKGASSNLYLVTFLATLFLLLFVSCAIVLRSYLLRRRYQRQIEHALAHGIVLAPRTPGSRKKRFGTRPHLYESWIAPLHVSGVSGGASLGKELTHGGRWSDMLPLTVQTVIVKRRTKDASALSAFSSPATVFTSESTAFNNPGNGTPLDSSNVVRFAPSPAEVPPAPGRLGAFFSRFSSSQTPPIATPASRPTTAPSAPSTTAPPPNTVPAAPAPRVRPGLFEFPHPNTHVDTQELLRNPRRDSALAHPQNQNRDRSDSARSRRESSVSNWRSIVSPSPSLAMAQTADDTNNAGVPPLPNAANRHSRRLSLPVLSTNLPSLGNNPGGRTPEGATPTTTGAWGFGRRAGLTTSPTTANSLYAPADINNFIRYGLGVNINNNNSNNNNNSGNATGGPSRAGSKYRVRTEMLQISVLVAMPDVKTSALYGDAGVVKRLRAQQGRRLGGRGVGEGHHQDQDRDVDGQFNKAGGDGVVEGVGDRRPRKRDGPGEGGERAVRRGHGRRRSEDEGDEDEIVEVPGDDSSSISSSSSDEDEKEDDDDDDEEEENAPLPELVLGVTRLNYRHAVSGGSPAPNFVIPSVPPPPIPTSNSASSILPRSNSIPPAPAPIPVQAQRGSRMSALRDAVLL
ncbi:hypothetical protein D9611_009406 [Ephemerocybe angulata]|uniref:Uncharacterized protein n=1 Tax=Ephemerocybe angulata TaxID=980116 RepID=A0A8H5ETD6_9AGAR|nr:hypothetical protein D9611_009406 [Tulosesus angulatus]